MTAYYNEIDPYAAQWLKNLINSGQIAPGEVDSRSIVDVRPDDLRGFDQCHFFAGIGGWSIALRIAGWPDDQPVWTGSCPCQPFSAAGAGRAFADERHLWPAWHPLIAERRPPIVFGEQVEKAIKWGWLDLVFTDLENEGYACGAAILPACGIGAPHIRQRIWFVADALRGRTGYAPGSGLGAETAADLGDRDLPRQGLWAREQSAVGRVADTNGRDASAEGIQRGGEHGQQPQDGRSVRLGDAGGAGFQERERDGRIQREALESSEGQTAVGRSNSWDCDWLPCTDGKARPVRPGSFPLAHGVQRRPSKLRAYGNAIVPQIAAQFIRAASK